MNKKGIMFSIEVLFALVLVGTGIFLINYPTESYDYPNQIEIRAHSNSINSLYFNQPDTTSEAENGVCFKIVDEGTSDFVTKQICEGYQ